MILQKNILITGASTGIGEACALEFDRMGWRVFATVRREADVENLRQKASEKLTPVLMDVVDSASIQQAAEFVKEQVGEGGLHGLINNAGIAVAGPLEFLPIEELRRQIEVNVIGQVAVTQAFLPLLRQADSPKARIVNIGSVSGLLVFPMLGPYNASKFALEAVNDAFRMELKPFGIHVALVDPSGIKTPIWEKSTIEGNALAEKLPAQAHEWYGELFATMRKSASHSAKTGAPVEKVVACVVHALTHEKPRTRYIIGIPKPLVMILRALPDRRRDAIILRMLARRGKK